MWGNKQSKQEIKKLELWGGGPRTQHKMLGPTDHSGATYPMHLPALRDNNVPDLTASSCSLLWHQKTGTEERAVCGYGHGHFYFSQHETETDEFQPEKSAGQVCKSSVGMRLPSTKDGQGQKMDKCCIFPKLVLCA